MILICHELVCRQVVIETVTAIYLDVIDPESDFGMAIEICNELVLVTVRMIYRERLTV